MRWRGEDNGPPALLLVGGATVGVYKAVIRKSYGGIGTIKQWTNVYHLNTPTIADAASIVSLVADTEIAMSDVNVYFLNAKLSDPTKVEAPITVDLGGVQGDQAFSGSPIPHWNVVNVIFDDTGGGHVERKYYRLGLTEGAVDGESIDGTLFTTLQSLIDNLVSTVIALCAPNGDTISSGTVQSLIGMRQEHWSRRSRPGFHRDYVPNT